MTKTIEELRSEAALLMAEIRPLEKRLQQLRNAHGELAWQIEEQSRRETAVRKIAAGVSGRKQRRPLDISTESLAKQFAAIPPELQQQLLRELTRRI